MKPTETTAPDYITKAIEKIVCEDCAETELKQAMLCNNEEFPCAIKNDHYKIYLKRYELGGEMAKRVNKLIL